MKFEYYGWDDGTSLYHFGILGQKWGVRRFQNPDGTLTEEGKRRYAKNIRKEITRSRYNSKDRIVDKTVAAIPKKYSVALKADYKQMLYDVDRVNKVYDKIDRDMSKTDIRWYDKQGNFDLSEYNKYFEKLAADYGLDLALATQEKSTAKYKQTLRSAVDNMLGKYGNEKVKPGMSLKDYTYTFLEEQPAYKFIEKLDNKSKH